MRKITTLIAIVASFYMNAQVGIGTITPDASAALEIETTTKGLLIPRLTAAEKTAITAPATGLLIFQTDGATGFWYYTGTGWTTFSGSGWSLTGNASTSATTNYLGTTDGQDLSIVTNNIERILVATTGKVGVGKNTPSTVLHIVTNQPTIDGGFETNTLAPFTTSGSANWLITSTVGEFKTGSFGAKSGNIGHNQVSNLELTGTAPAGGEIVSFSYKLDAHKFDGMHFFINGIEQKGSTFTYRYISPVWETLSFSIPAGAYTLKWEYKKNGSTSTGADELYVDDIKIGAAPMQLSDGGELAEKMLSSDANGVVTWRGATAITALDGDWAADNGAATNVTPIYHQGNIMVGQTTPSTYNLHVYAGGISGTQVGWGSVEIVEDGVAHLQVNYDFSSTTTNNFNVGSPSNRWKTAHSFGGVLSRTASTSTADDIKPLHYGLDEILQLNPASFQWKEEKINDYIIPGTQKEVKLGLITQEVLPILPEIIKTHYWKEYEENPGVLVQEEMRRMGISYNELIPVLIKAIQEQQKVIEALESQNLKVKAMLQNLKH